VRAAVEVTTHDHWHTRCVLKLKNNIAVPVTACRKPFRRLPCRLRSLRCNGPV
jgi:hypothetical protein